MPPGKRRQFDSFLRSPNILSTAIGGRGPVDRWTGDHCILAASTVSGPLAATSGLVVAADARLDNRAELQDILRVGSPDSCNTILIAAAYRRWGEMYPAHLVGDFAFLIWDPDERRLFCARDLFGVRPFYYHLSDRLFAAATTVTALVTLGLGKEVDETGMADFVAGAVADKVTTISKGIQRLPPAHSLTVGYQTDRASRYWTLGETAPYAGADAAEGFRDLFQEAVRCRLSPSASTGVMLSGGLDSSSIAIVAARLDTRQQGLPSFSMTFDSIPDWNEGPFIGDVLGSGHFRSVRIPSGDHDPLADLDVLLREQEGPFLAPNHSVSRRLYHAAHADGITVLLDGHGGDEVVSMGYGRLNELAMEGRWSALWHEAKGIAALYGQTTWSVASPYFNHLHLVRSARWYWRVLGSRVVPASRPDGSHAPSADLTTDLVASALAARTGVEARQRALRPARNMQATERDLQLHVLNEPQQPYAFEVLDRTAAAAGVTALYPFYDRRLVEFSVSLPAREKLDGGFPRKVLRDAMSGLLPDRVRLRRDKYDFSGQLAIGMARHGDALTRMMEKDEVGLGEYVNMDVARNALKGLLSAGKGAGTAHILPVWRTAVLAAWLVRDRAPAVVDPAQRSSAALSA